MLMPAHTHPTARTLISYLDGELEAAERRKVADHLTTCADCRGELDYMESDLDWFLVLEAALHPAGIAQPEDGLKQLLANARSWRKANSPAAVPADSRGLDGGLSDALELFFGPAVAGTVERSPCGTEDCTESAENLLTTFLGRRAGSAVMTNLQRRVQAGRFLNQDLS
jgi:anti-sigma factor RsiW